jgi:hypothetical protein
LENAGVTVQGMRQGGRVPELVHLPMTRSNKERWLRNAQEANFVTKYRQLAGFLPEKA